MIRKMIPFLVQKIQKLFDKDINKIFGAKNQMFMVRKLIPFLAQKIEILLTRTIT